MANIQDTDYFLIDVDGVTKKVTALNLKNNLSGDYSSHKLLVNLSDYSSRVLYCGDLYNKLLSSHWMVIESGGQSYKVSGTKVHDYIGPPPQLLLVKILQHLSMRLVIVSLVQDLLTILEHMTLVRFRLILLELEEFILG